MKHLILTTGLAASLSLPVIAQPIGGPIQLRNPHRRGGDGETQGVGGLGSTMPSAPANGFYGSNMTAATSPSVPPPSVIMFVDGSYLFILRGDSLYQFDKNTLKLINSTELPRPAAPPAPTPPQDDIRTHTSPPLRPGTQFKIGPTF